MRDNALDQKDRFGGPGSSELSDSDIIVVILNFCRDTPRLRSQIMSYCRLSSFEFRRYMGHCVARKLLRVSLNRTLIPAGIEQYELTSKGAKLLETVSELREGLGIGSVDSILKKEDGSGDEDYYISE